MNGTRVAGIAVAALAAALISPTMIFAPAHAATSALVAADPTPDEVMANAVKAVGGRDALAKINTLRVVMGANMQGMELKLESYWTREGAHMARTVLPMGEMLMASDGKIAWTKNPMGYALLSDDERKQLKDQSSSFMRVVDPQEHLKDAIKSIENKGKETFGEKECWRLDYVENDGKTGTAYYDVASGLPVGFVSVEKQGEMEVRSTGFMSDWKEEQGVKFFRTMTMTSDQQAGMAMTMKVESVEINTLTAETFAVPDEVKKLVENQPKPAAPGEAAKEIKLEDMNDEQRAMATQALEGVKRAGDVNAQKLMLKQIESVVDITPEDQKMPLMYVIQELRKEIAKQGG